MHRKQTLREEPIPSGDHLEAEGGVGIAEIFCLGGWFSLIELGRVEEKT